MKIRLDPPLLASEISQVVSAKMNVEDRYITHIATDSRETEVGTLFLSLAKDKHLRTDYELETIQRGGIPLTDTLMNNSIIVDNIDSALIKLSGLFIDRLPFLKHRIAITGSVGKTTTKEFLAKILSEKYKIHYTFKNYNNSLGVLISILTAPYETEAIILEVGSNHRGEISAISKSISPTLSAITRIGTAHIGQFGSLNELIQEKTDILVGMKKAKLVHDFDLRLNPLFSSSITASCIDNSANIYLKPVEEKYDRTVFKLFNNQKLIDTMCLNIGGRHILHCLAIAIALSVETDVNYDDIKRGIEKIKCDSARHRTIKVDDYYILDDSYNASLESVEADLNLLKHHNGKTSALLGDIYELGDMTEEIHRRIGALAHSNGVSHLYLFGKYAKFIYEGAYMSGMNKDCIFINEDINNPNISACDIKKNHFPNELILFKASNKANLYRILNILQNQGKDE